MSIYPDEVLDLFNFDVMGLCELFYPCVLALGLPVEGDVGEACGYRV